jgi:hypothetical protein
MKEIEEKKIIDKVLSGIWNSTLCVLGYRKLMRIKLYIGRCN